MVPGVHNVAVILYDSVRNCQTEQVHPLNIPHEPGQTTPTRLHLVLGAGAEREARTCYPSSSLLFSQSSSFAPRSSSFAPPTGGGSRIEPLYPGDVSL